MPDESINLSETHPVSEASLTDANAKFFLVVTPGFEGEARAELADWAPELSAKVERGGVEFEAPLAVGYGLNRVLKIPTRILVRLADYGCRDFPKLYKKMASFAWDQWVADTASIEFSASSHNSRLRMKKRIEETCADGRKAYLKKRGVAANDAAVAKVLVRFEDDICWVSLDTSGERLHKRGLRPLSSLAPLRETVAAGLIRYLESFGLTSAPVELVDPMTGGGTFLLEAFGQRRGVESRNFAFEDLVSGKDGATFKDHPGQYSVFTGFEADEKVLTAARENLAGVPKLDLRGEDFFKAAPLSETAGERWLIANPPYGERLRIEGPLFKYYEDLFAAAERVVQPTRALFVLPEKVNPSRLKLPARWGKLGSKAFLNGGYPVVALVFGRSATALD